MDSKCLHIHPRLFFKLCWFLFFWGGTPLSSFLSPRLPNQSLLCFGGGGPFYCSTPLITILHTPSRGSPGNPRGWLFHYWPIRTFKPLLCRWSDRLHIFAMVAPGGPCRHKSVSGSPLPFVAKTGALLH